MNLELKAEDGTFTASDIPPVSVRFYESSACREGGDPLLSVYIPEQRCGLRLTPAQVRELRDWLDDWLLEGVEW